MVMSQIGKVGAGAWLPEGRPPRQRERTVQLVATVLTRASGELAGLVARAAPSLVAIRTDPGRHVTGTVWHPDLVVTADRALPALDSCAVVAPSGAVVVGRVAQRDAGLGLVAIRLSMPVGATLPPPAVGEGAYAVGSLVLTLGATGEARPTARLCLVHAEGPATPGGPRWLMLAAADPAVAPLALHAGAGGPTLDAAGGLLGIVVAGPDGAPAVVPHATVAAFLAGVAVTPAQRRGWLGLALQPVEVHGRFGLGTTVGKGRLVVGVTAGGPGEQAGIKSGDTLLAIDGKPINGHGALREFLGPERVGTTLELRLSRDGRSETRRLTIIPQPGG